jgi:hypothetical protein
LTCLKRLLCVACGAVANAEQACPSVFCHPGLCSGYAIENDCSPRRGRGRNRPADGATAAAGQHLVTVVALVALAAVINGGGASHGHGPANGDGRVHIL